jgi:hypothetical protein
MSQPPPTTAASSSVASPPPLPATTTSHDRWTLVDDSTIPYGYLSRTGGNGIADAEYGSSYYITTAINYTNGTNELFCRMKHEKDPVLVEFFNCLFGLTVVCMLPSFI